MPFKTVLASLNEVPRNKIILEQAARLAASAEGYVQGLYVIPAAQLYPSAAVEPMPVIFETHCDYFKSRIDEVKSAFEAAMRGYGARGMLEVVDSASPLISDSVVEHGRRADLVLLSQVNSQDSMGVELDFIDRVVMAVGRPVIVLPLKSPAISAIGTAIIAWNGSREAARAAFDSVSLLRQAKEVRIVWIDPQRELDGPTGLAGTDLAEIFARHGINAIAEPIPSNGREAGEALLTKVFDTGANLLVMGAYGHNRLREFILGGATRHTLGHMTCPVLYSH